MEKKGGTREALLDRLNRAVTEGVTPGGVVGMIRKDGTRHVIPFGRLTYDTDSPYVTEDTIYDVASLTKSFVTGSLALQLIDEGKLRTSDKIIDHLPEYQRSDREQACIKHLLTYSLDGFSLAALREFSPEEIRKRILMHEVRRAPGTAFNYSNIPAYLMGLVIERMCKSTLDMLADEHFFVPLEMTRTTFFPETFSQEKISPTEIDFRGVVQGVVHDESAWVFKTKAHEVVGHAGLFSTAPDLLKFLEIFLHGGEYRGKQYFSKDMITHMTTNQLSDIGECTGLGWELNQSRFMGRTVGEHTFGKTGFTGTLAVCDIARGVACALLTNRTYPHRPPDSSAINALRADVSDSVFGMYTD